MDIIQEFPENEREEVIQTDIVAAFGLTFRGVSHKQATPPAPCQDSHAIRWMEGEEILLAAIADGVGSCKLSHWGAYTAVNTALDIAQQQLQALSGGRKLTLGPENPDFRRQMKEIMVSAFRGAQDAVEALADSAQPPQPVFSFQSTLTMAIYDGKCLYHGHAGDDGIVAQLPDGTVEMATRRMKGEEASSVYPLQTGESAWRFGLVPEVAGFVMATDGVLDAFVQSHPDYFGINYCNGICYAFMEDAMKLLTETEPDSARKAMALYRDFLQSEEYTRQVTDDLTLVAVVSPGIMAKASQPDFSLELWNTIARESMAAKRRALNHQAARKSAHAPVLPQREDAVTEAEAPELPEYPKKEADKRGFDRFLKGLMLFLMLAAAMLCGLLLGRLLLSRQYEENRQALTQQYQERYDALARQYQALTLDHEALKESCARTEQALQTAQQAAIEMEETLAQREQELESLRQQLEELTSETEHDGDAAE